MKPFGIVSICVVIIWIVLVVGSARWLRSHLNSASERASRKCATVTAITALRTALDAYAEDTGAFPSQESTLDFLVRNGGVKGWTGPYLRDERLPRDAWGNLFRYRLTNGVPVIISAGSDGIFDTSDDLTN